MKIRVGSGRLRGGRAWTAAGNQHIFAQVATRWVITALIWLLPVLTANAGMSYVYDDNGRLVAASRDDGTASRYTYDSVGNILSIDSIGKDDLVIFSFSPVHGDVGQVVTLTGAHFGAQPADNAVAFAGVPATVVSSSPTQIVTSVPAGASTGKVTVSTGGRVAESAIPFTVDGTGHPPVISHVEPLVAAAGSSIAVTGTYLAPTPGQTAVRLNSYVVSTSALDNDHASFVVAGGIGSGKVSVTTPFGRAVSSEDVLIVPPGINPLDVLSTQRMVVDGPQVNVAMPSAAKYAAVLFDASSGAALSMQWSTIAPAGTSIAYSIYDSRNALVASGSVTSSSPTIHMPYAKQAGTFLLLTKSTVPAQMTLGLESASLLTSSNASLHLATNVANQSKRLLITATTGEDLGFDLSAITTTSSYNDVLLRLTGPNGVDVGTTWCYASSGCAYNVSNAIGGKYVAVISSEVGATMGFTATVSRDVVGPNIPRDAPAVTFATSSLGQNGSMTFDAVAGETIALSISGQSTVPAGANVGYTVLNPDGSVLTSFTTASWNTLNLTNLPASGRYKIYVDPAPSVSSMTVGATVTSGIHGVLTVEGPSVSFATATPSQAVYVTFDSVGGENLNLGVTDITTPSSYHDVLVTIFDPLNQQIASNWCTATSLCAFNLPNAKAGTYRITVSSESGVTMGFAAHVTRDIVGPAIPRDNGVATLQLTKQAQNGWMSFDGVAGETIALNITGQTTTPAGQSATYTIYKPDGTTYTSFSMESWNTLNFVGLPATGTYKVFVDPAALASTFTVQAGITSGIHGVLTVEGPSVSFATTTPSQAVYVTFDSVGGENLNLGVTDITTPSSYHDVLVTIFDPLNQQIASSWCYTTALCAFNLPNAKAGTYRITVSSESGVTMGFAAHVTRDIVGPAIPRDNGVATLQLTKQAQNGWMSFDGVAGETIALNITGQTTTPAGQSATYTIYKPDGTTYTSFSMESWNTLNFVGLPATGTYKVFVDPAALASTFTVQAGITSGIHGVLTVEGPSVSFATTTPSQAVYVTFDSVGGENLNLGVTDITTPSSYHDVLVTIFDPLNQQIASSWCYTTALCAFNLPNAKAGTYRITVSSESGVTMGFAAHVTRDIVGPAIPRDNGVATLQLTKQAQNGWMSFDGVAGETIALNITGQTTTPAGQSATYTIYKPDGTTYTSFSMESWNTLNFVGLPATGTYKVFVDPAALASTFTVQAGITSGIHGVLTVEGPSVSFATTTPSQAVYVTFDSVGGENLNLGVTDITTPSSYHDVLVTIFDPLNQQIASSWCYTTALCAFNLPNAKAGTYRITVSSESGVTMGFAAHVTRDIVGPAIPRDNGVATLQLTKQAQNGWMSFDGVAGETIALNITGQTTTPAGQSATYTIYKPDGTTYTSFSTESWSTQNYVGLPATGTYKVFVDPAAMASTFAAQVAVASGVTGNLSLDGPSVALQTIFPSQNAYVSYVTGSTAAVNVNITNVSTTSSYHDVRVTLVDPTGSNLADRWCTVSPACVFPVTTTAGTYKIIVTPESGATMGFSASVTRQ